MVRCNDMAVALRARGGRNMLLQMRGIAAGDVKEAAKQVVASLSRFAKSGGKSDPDGPGDLPPNFSYGYMTVNNKRHNAIYRLVNSVYVIVIASPLTPLFSLVKMVDAVTKQLVEACKGPEVTLDKVAKRYAEIYVGIGALLAVGGASLSLAASEASTLMSVMFPEEKKERFGSFSSFSRGKKGDSASGANGVPPLPLRSSQAAGVRRSLVDGVKLGDATVDGPSPPTSSRRGTSRRDSLTPRSASAMGAAAAGAAGWDYGDEEQFTTGTHTPAPSSRPSESGGVDWNAFGPDPSSGGGMSAGVAASSEQDTSFDSVPPSSDSPLFGNTPQWAPQQQARTTATGDVFESDSSFQAFDNNMFNQNNSSVVEDSAWQAFDNSPLQQPPASTANAAYASNNNSFDSEGFASFSAAHNEEAGFATSAADVPNHDFGTFLEPSTANSTAPFTAFGDTAPQGGAITTSAASAAAADSAWGAAGGDDPFLAPGGGDSFNVDDSFFGSGNAGQPPPIAPTAEQSAFGDTSSFFPAAPTPTHAPFFSGGAAVAGFDAFGAGASNASGAFDAPSDVFSQPIAPHVVSPTAVPPVPGGLQLIEVWQASFCGLKLSSTELAAEVQMGAGGSGGALGFTLSANNVASSSPLLPLLQHAISGAQLKEGLCQRGSGAGSFTVISASDSTKAVLRYFLPPAATLPPVLLQVSLGTPLDSPPKGNGGQAQPLLVSVQYGASPMLPADLQDVVIQVQLPSELGTPVQASPAMEWYEARRLVQWHIPGGVASGSRGVMHALLHPHHAAPSPGSGLKATMAFSLHAATFSGISCFAVSAPGANVARAVGLATATPS